MQICQQQEGMACETLLFSVEQRVNMARVKLQLATLLHALTHLLDVCNLCGRLA
jgi:hypothetical protein